ncbi:MAG: CHASE2 domain-containing protein [Elainellaceae cyanobacterium]
MARLSLGVWHCIQREVGIWRVGALPGLMVIALVVGARWMGLLQSTEMMALDAMLRSRPAEPTDERILIVGIDEDDVRSVGTYPVPDNILADLLTTLERSQPAVIGIDIYRDLPVEPGHDQLTALFETMPHIIGIEKIFSARDASSLQPTEPGDGVMPAVHPPPALPPDQIGFVDVVLDSDGKLRRSLLATHDPNEQFKFSFTIQLARQYLERQNITLTNGDRDPVAMQFGSVELTRFHPNSGGYSRELTGGNQIFMNFRNGDQPFRIVSLRAIQAGEVPDDWIRDRIVLIGMTTPSIGDYLSSSALASRNPGLHYGVEMHAHALSQLVSAVLDDRPLLQSWTERWNYVWIIAWGLLGISLGRIIPSPVKLVFSLGITSLLLVSCAYGLLLLGWWVPLTPALLALMINSAGLTASLFYLHEQTLRARLQERQLVIEQTFDAIHNGPLQTLAKLLQDYGDQEKRSPSVYANLQHLNQELRDVYEAVRQESSSDHTNFYLTSGLQLNLQDPIHELLYEVYHHTLTRDFPNFKTLKIKLTTFEDVDNRRLTEEQKRGLCRFLEEALCNIGKHATGVRHLQVECKPGNRSNILRIVDDGSGLETMVNIKAGRSHGRGTQQAKSLAHQLSGSFQRRPNHPHGTICELTWPITQPWFWRF